MVRESFNVFVFFLFASLAGFGFYFLAWLQNDSSSPLLEVYWQLNAYWLFSFIAIGMINLVVFAVRSNVSATNQSAISILANSDWAVTLRYLATACASMILGFLMFVSWSGGEQKRINTFDAFIGFAPIFAGWLIVFAILSFIRLTTLYFRRGKRDLR